MQLGIQPAFRPPDEAAAPVFGPPIFYPQARGRPVRLQIRRVYHDNLLLAAFGGQPLHHPGEDPPIAPPLPSVVEGLWGAILTGRITPPPPIATDEDYAAQIAPVIDAGLAMALREERPQPFHLFVGQPEKVAHLHPRQFRGLNHASRAASTR